MRYYLSPGFVLKWLESPSLYDIREDELYELDDEAFLFLQECAAPGGCDPDGEGSGFVGYCISEKILTEDRISTRRPPVIKSSVPSLRYLELQITDRCNLRCRHCYIGEPKNWELSIPELKSVLEEFEAMQGLRLLITGGEPLMHSRFAQFNALLPDYAFRKILFTNGLMLDPKLLGSLNIDEIQFSIDGMEHGHDALRGKGTFRRVIKIVEESISAGFPVSIATMVHRGNLDEFDEMDRLFRGLGIKDWTVDVPSPEGYFKDNEMLRVPPETGGRFLGYGFGGGLHGGGEGFGCGLHLAAVLAGGDICKCAFYSGSPAGNIKEGLGRVWARIKPVDLGELECARSSCAFLDECRGGCRYRASVAEGNGRASKDRDLYKCYYYGIMK